MNRGREIERESFACALPTCLCVFANQRVAKGAIENQDDEIVSCRDDSDENLVGASAAALASISEGGREGRARTLS